MEIGRARAAGEAWIPLNSRLGRAYPEARGSTGFRSSPEHGSYREFENE